MQGLLPNTLGHPQNGSKVPKGAALPTTSSLGRRGTAASPRITIRRLSRLLAILMIYTELSTTVRPPTNCGLLPLRFARLTSRRFQQAFLKGLDHILEALYPTGGWPQFYPPSNHYHRHITFNDGATVNILRLLLNVSYSSNYASLKVGYGTKAKAAIAKSIECILKTQIKQDDKLTVWCAQHDEKTYEPKWGRAYEPPTLSGSESVGIVRFLMSVEDPTPEIVAAIEGAIA